MVGAWQQLAAVVRQLTPFLPHKCLPFRPPPAAALQERAWVTGLSAANLVIQQLGRGQPAAILPVEPDEPHIAAAKELNRSVKSALYSTGLRSPFL